MFQPLITALQGFWISFKKEIIISLVGLFGPKFVDMISNVFSDPSKLIIKSIDKLHESVKGIATSMGVGVDKTNGSEEKLETSSNIPRVGISVRPEVPPIPPAKETKAISATDAEEIKSSHSKVVKDCIKAMEEMKKPLEDLVKALRPTEVEGVSATPASSVQVAPSVKTPAEIIKGDGGTNDGLGEVKQEITEMDKVKKDYVKIFTGFWRLPPAPAF